VYTTILEALDNKAGFVPSPADLATALKRRRTSKPVRVVKLTGGATASTAWWREEFAIGHGSSPTEKSGRFSIHTVTATAHKEARDVKRYDGIKTFENQFERGVRKSLVRHFKTCPIPENSIIVKSRIVLNSKNLSRILFMSHLYQRIVDIPGIVHGNLASDGDKTCRCLQAMRGLYDPFNGTGTIVGFDTFKRIP